MAGPFYPQVVEEDNKYTSTTFTCLTPIKATLKELEIDIKRLKKFIEELDEIEKAISVLFEGIGNFKVGEFFIEHFIDLMERYYGDENEWIEWFVWENGFGEKKFSAKPNGNSKERKIKTVKDLWWLLQNQE